jgi:hypothetical protein
VELAYATTVYGAQGETTSTGHMLITETTSGSAAYVGMTRGRDNNIAHLVAENPEQARVIWNDVMSRDRADLGPAHAKQRAAEDMERYAPQPATSRQRAALRPPPVQRHPKTIEPALPTRQSEGPRIGL